VWLELEIARAGAEMRLRARGSRGEETSPIPLGPGLDLDALKAFASTVRGAAMRGRALPTEALQTAQTLARALLGPEVDPLRARLAETAQGPLLLRLLLSEPEIAAIPWEALCKPGEALGFWASSPDLLPVRRVITTEPWQPRAVRGAVRVLAVAPTGGASLAILKSALAKPSRAAPSSGSSPSMAPPQARAPCSSASGRSPCPMSCTSSDTAGSIRASPSSASPTPTTATRAGLPWSSWPSSSKRACAVTCGSSCSSAARAPSPRSSPPPPRSWGAPGRTLLSPTSGPSRPMWRAPSPPSFIAPSPGRVGAKATPRAPRTRRAARSSPRSRDRPRPSPPSSTCVGPTG
jgi:hypothetical protein